MERNCYVYVHAYIDGRGIIYCGKGTQKRAWNKTSRTEIHKAFIRAGEINVIIVQDNLTSKEAHDLERAITRVLYLSGSPLINKYSFCFKNDAAKTGKPPYQPATTMRKYKGNESLSEILNM